MNDLFFLDKLVLLLLLNRCVLILKGNGKFSFCHQMKVSGTKVFIPLKLHSL